MFIVVLAPGQHLLHHAFRVLQNERSHGKFRAGMSSEMFQCWHGAIPVLQTELFDVVGEEHGRITIELLAGGHQYCHGLFKVGLP